MKAVLFLLCLVVSGAVLLNAASSLVAPVSPSTGVLLNPLNANARLRSIAEHINPEQETGFIKELSAAEAAIRITPADARGYSMLADVRALTGDITIADALYSEALARSGSDLRALFRKIAIHAGQNEPDKAAEWLKILMLRWPNEWSKMMPLIRRIAGSDDGARAIVASLRTEKRQMRLLIQELRNSPQDLNLATALTLALARTDADYALAEVEKVMRALVAAEDPDNAYRLFQFTKTAEERQASGYVFNGDFTRKPIRRPFDWNISSQSGVELRRLSDDRNVNDGENGLSLEFLSSPLRLNNVRQTLRLPPGRYRLSVIASAETAKTPKPVQWKVRCRLGSGAVLMALDSPQSTYQNVELTEEFSVPGTGCELQEIFLSNNEVRLDWNSRYQGRLKFHEVSIERF